MKSTVLYRYIAVFIILAAFLAQTFSSAFVIADYYANKQAYAKHCENKDKPMMHCNGKCQMMKKMQQEERKDQDNPEGKGDNKNDLTLSSKSFFATVATVYNYTPIIKNCCPQTSGTTTDRSLDIFHPPQHV